VATQRDSKVRETRIRGSASPPLKGCILAWRDWFPGRIATPAAATVEHPRAADGSQVADHSAVVVDVAL